MKHCYWLSSIHKALTQCTTLTEVNLLGCNVNCGELLDILHHNPRITTLSWTIGQEAAKQLNYARKIEEAFSKLKILTVEILNIDRKFEQCWRYFRKFNEILKINIIEVKFNQLRQFECVEYTQPQAISCDNDTIDFFLENNLLHLTGAGLTDKIKVAVTYSKPEVEQYTNVKKLCVHSRNIETTNVESYRNLVYIDAKLGNFGKDLQTLSELNPSLKYLNLIENSFYIKEHCIPVPEQNDISLQGLDGLRSLASKCRNLRHLNITRVHCHRNRNHGKEVAQIISLMGSLEALAVCCCVFGRWNKRELPKPKSCIHSKTKDDLDHLAQLTYLTELEILNFDKCEWIIFAADVEVLSRLKYLKKLTMSEIRMHELGEFLKSIGQNCALLEYLSLQDIDQHYSRGYRNILIQSLSYFKCLKHLRVEQEKFGISKTFVESLYDCKQLQSLTVATTKGWIKRTVDFVELFLQCEDLTKLMIFSATRRSMNAKIQCLKDRFLPSRPALWITMEKNEKIWGDLLDNVPSLMPYYPYHITRDFVQFQSRVAHMERIHELN